MSMYGITVEVLKEENHAKAGAIGVVISEAPDNEGDVKVVIDGDSDWQWLSYKNLKPIKNSAPTMIAKTGYVDSPRSALIRVSLIFAVVSFAFTLAIVLNMIAPLPIIGWLCTFGCLALGTAAVAKIFP